MNFRPHDLVWVSQIEELSIETELPNWVTQQWRIELPLVIRRDKAEYGFVPVGVRGKERSERFAAWVKSNCIIRSISPETLVAERQLLVNSVFFDLPPLQALLCLQAYKLPWAWGVTGSCGYALATGIPVMTDDSDLDLVIRCPQQVDREDFVYFAELLKKLPCRVDPQIETLYGGFALNEWLRDHKVMLKTAVGPLITSNPWQLEERL